MKSGGGLPCRDFWTAAAVFTGKVLEISTILVEVEVEVEPGNPNWKTQERLVRFSIEKTFKGSTGKEVELITGGTLYGNLNMPNPEKIKIKIEGEGKLIETWAGKDGNYRVSGLPPGQYKVTADLPKHIPHYPYYTVHVIDRACVQLNFRN